VTLSVVLAVLATARLTRLVTTDVLFETPRTAVLQKLINPGRARVLRDKLAYLVVCDWCASMYVAPAVFGAWWAWGETMWFIWATGALTASYVTGALAARNGGD
jgi:hypothetical protein